MRRPLFAKIRRPLYRRAAMDPMTQSATMGSRPQMPGPRVLVIAAIALLVIAVIYYFALRSSGKEGYHNNWGLRATPPKKFKPGCSSGTPQAMNDTCSVMCQQASHGQTYTNCMHNCMQGDMDNMMMARGSSCMGGAC